MFCACTSKNLFSVLHDRCKKYRIMKILPTSLINCSSLSFLTDDERKTDCPHTESRSPSSEDIKETDINFHITYVVLQRHVSIPIIPFLIRFSLSVYLQVSSGQSNCPRATLWPLVSTVTKSLALLKHFVDVNFGIRQKSYLVTLTDSQTNRLNVSSF